jgi:hypothetical protein
MDGASGRAELKSTKHEIRSTKQILKAKGGMFQTAGAEDGAL